MIATVATVMYALAHLIVLMAIWGELARLVETLNKGGRE